MKALLLLTGFAALAVPVAEAWAQIATYRVRPGLGAQVRPEFPGADSSEWALYPTISVARDDKPFAFGAPDDSIGISLFSSGDFSAGPVVHLKGSRTNSEVGAPVGRVDSTVEAGGFAQYQLSPSLRLRGEIRQGIGGHEGLIGRIGVDQVWRDGDRYLFSIGPRLIFTNERYQRSYFGVSPQAAAATGLTPYRPDGGLNAVAAVSRMDYALGGGWGLFGYARYKRLLGDPADSPIVEELGSPNQFSAGIGLNRTFTIKF